jgi:DNA-binding LytR/AlgR family response regulator
MDFPGFNDQGILRLMSETEVGCVRKDEATRKMIFCTGFEEYHAPWTVQEVEILLSPYGFIRIDKNKVINIHRVDEYINGVVKIGAMEFNVSRRKREEFEALLRTVRVT